METDKIFYPKAPERLLRYLLKSGLAPHLLTHVRELQHLQTIFAQVVKPELADYCYLIKYKDGKLKIGADAAAWAARLRFDAPELIRLLRTYPEFEHLQEIICKVRPKSETLTHCVLAKPQISSQNIKLIQETASHIKDPQLRGALERFAKNAAGTDMSSS